VPALDPALISEVGSTAVISMIALALLFFVTRQIMVRLETMGRQLENLTLVTMNFSQMLAMHDLTVRGLNDAVDGDGAQALKVYEEWLHGIEDLRRQIRPIP
jgi:hypothetical protein